MSLIYDDTFLREKVVGRLLQVIGKFTSDIESQFMEMNYVYEIEYEVGKWRRDVHGGAVDFQPR
jgi:hypothetical protein